MIYSVQLSWYVVHLCLSYSGHLHHLGAVRDACQAFGVDHAILFAGEQLIPPTKEEIAGNKFEPWRERVVYT
jgi:methylmalonyl-CoA mutase cobalamin-binding subunit